MDKNDFFFELMVDLLNS